MRAEQQVQVLAADRPQIEVMQEELFESVFRHMSRLPQVLHEQNVQDHIEIVEALLLDESSESVANLRLQGT